MGKKLVMAQKRGETRALCLGVAMVVCAAITYYILGTTLLPLHQRRYFPAQGCEPRAGRRSRTRGKSHRRPVPHKQQMLWSP